MLVLKKKFTFFPTTIKISASFFPVLFTALKTCPLFMFDSCFQFTCAAAYSIHSLYSPEVAATLTHRRFVTLVDVSLSPL